MRPAVFFDRDGVLNVEKNYLYKIEDFQWQQGAFDAICHLKQQGYYVFVVTNQSGIARDYYTCEDVERLHVFINEQLALNNSCIDEFYYCPHHPDFGEHCDCRKPNPGMILQAFSEYDIDKKSSFLVGDKQSDLKAAQNAGIDGYLYQDGDLLSFIKNILATRDSK